MVKATIHQAKTNLSKLIEQAEHGEDVVICRGKKPVAKIVALESTPIRPILGGWEGKFHVGPEFFEPLSEDELKEWGF